MGTNDPRGMNGRIYVEHLITLLQEIIHTLGLVVSDNIFQAFTC